MNTANASTAGTSCSLTPMCRSDIRRTKNGAHWLRTVVQVSLNHRRSTRTMVLATEVDRPVTETRHRASADELHEPGGDAPEHVSDLPRHGRAPEDQDEDDDRDRQNRDAHCGRPHEGGIRVPGDHQERERDGG